MVSKSMSGMAGTIGTVDACRIARIDRVRLTDAISRGVYTPPATTQGHERQFDQLDLLQLFLFARYLDAGMKQVTAAVSADFDVQQVRKFKQNGTQYSLRKLITNRIQLVMFSDIPLELLGVMTSPGESLVGDEADSPVRRQA
jgi:hypothetical protein